MENDIATLERFDFNVALVIPLAAEEIPTLAQKISSLPLEYMNTLFFRYCFDFSPEDTDDMLETTHSVGRLRYVRNMLSPSLWDWMEPWSMNIDPGPYHKGIDLKCSTSGATIRTAHSGNLNHNDDYGTACIQTKYGSSKRTYIYAHMTDLAPVGYVSAGTEIGNQGSKGANGEHLHFEVRTAHKKTLADPADFSQTQTTSPYSAMTIELSGRSLMQK